MKEEIVLFGGGGHCRSCIDVIEQEGHYEIAGIVDQAEKLHVEVLDYEVFATDDDIADLLERYKNYLITVGQITSPQTRIDLYENLQKGGAKFPVVVSPLAYVSSHASVQGGTIVMHHAVVNAGARIGVNCIINSKALIEHDSVIANHCHISTGAVINGCAKVGEGNFIGSNAVLRECVEIGDYAIVGAGTRVMQDVAPRSTHP